MVAAGKTRIEAAAAVGVNRRFVGEWVKAAAQSGEAALAGRRRGRRPGEQRALTAAQEDKLRGLIATQCPDQLHLPFALWTREAVQALIARETGVLPALPVVGRYLRRWGLTPQRPIRRATTRPCGHSIAYPRVTTATVALCASRRVSPARRHGQTRRRPSPGIRTPGPAADRRVRHIGLAHRGWSLACLLVQAREPSSGPQRRRRRPENA
jgi:transposase